MKDLIERLGAKPVAGYKGRYWVTPCGRVIVASAMGPLFLRPGAQARTEAGYLAVALYDAEGQRRRKSVHGLVARAFLGPRP